MDVIYIYSYVAKVIKKINNWQGLYWNFTNTRNISQASSFSIVTYK